MYNFTWKTNCFLCKLTIEIAYKNKTKDEKEADSIHLIQVTLLITEKIVSLFSRDTVFSVCLANNLNIFSVKKCTSSL